MPLPDLVAISDETLHTIAVHHGLRIDAITRLPDVGVINTIYLLGDDHTLRVPRDHPAHIHQLCNELAAIPAARAAGVRTPQLVASDDSCALLPVPYAIVERVHGATLGLLDWQPDDLAHTWRELGRTPPRLAPRNHALLPRPPTRPLARPRPVDVGTD